MGQRRMFSKKIINSARFLKMPIDTQGLYFHLALNADDDGIVEAWPIMKMVGAAEDSLKVLATKGLVKVLNEDLVSHITDWNEHNVIRADRKVDSIYKNLLLQIVPDAEVLKAKPRSDVDDNSKRLSGPSTDGISKDKLSKDKLKTIADKSAGRLENEVIDLFKEINPLFQRLYSNKTQRSAATDLAKLGIEEIKQLVEKVKRCQGEKFFPSSDTPLKMANNINKIRSFKVEEEHKPVVFKLYED